MSGVARLSILNRTGGVTHPALPGIPTGSPGASRLALGRASRRREGIGAGREWRRQVKNLHKGTGRQTGSQ